MVEESPNNEESSGCEKMPPHLSFSLTTHEICINWTYGTLNH